MTTFKHFCFPLKGLILKHCLYSMFLLVKENMSMVCCVVACQRSVHSCQEYRSVEQDQRQGSECEHEVYKSTALVLSSHDFCTTHIHQSHVRATLRHSSLQQGTQATYREWHKEQSGSSVLFLGEVTYQSTSAASWPFMPLKLVRLLLNFLVHLQKFGYNVLKLYVTARKRFTAVVINSI